VVRLRQKASSIIIARKSPFDDEQKFPISKLGHMQFF
jgi:hypothetical protein